MWDTFIVNFIRINSITILINKNLKKFLQQSTEQLRIAPASLSNIFSRKYLKKTARNVSDEILFNFILYNQDMAR